MKDTTKYQGIFPAFYACYAEDGSISPERVRSFTEYLIGKGPFLHRISDRQRRYRPLRRRLLR